MENYNPYKSVYVPSGILWERAKEKAQRDHINRSLSDVVCRLLEKWLNNEIVAYSDSENDNNL